MRGLPSWRRQVWRNMGARDFRNGLPRPVFLPENESRKWDPGQKMATALLTEWQAGWDAVAARGDYNHRPRLPGVKEWR